MKNIYILLIALFVIAFSNAQIVNIPDANFKDALVNDDVVDIDGDGYGDIDADINDDGEIQIAEALLVLSLNVSYKSITSLEGIQSFTNIEHLNFGDNLIDTIDVSQLLNLVSLDGDYNDLISLDVTQNTNLEILSLRQDEITYLDITQNVSLNRLICNNNLLTELDVLHNENLNILDISGNQITDINLNNLVNLTKLFTANNLLEDLDLSGNINLEGLYCGYNDISSLDISQNTNLEYLQIGNNLLTSLDVSQNINLKHFLCVSNQLVGLDLSQNQALETLRVSNNQLISLDVSQNPNMSYLYCIDNPLTSLNIQNGNNESFSHLNTWENYNLFCIQVDDVEYAANNNQWFIEPWTEYSEDCTLGIEDNAIYSFSIYPNPVQNVLFIESQQQIETVKIYSLQGQLIKESSKSSLDVSQLNAGLYFVQVTIEGKMITKKFIKN